MLRNNEVSKSLYQILLSVGRRIWKFSKNTIAELCRCDQILRNGFTRLNIYKYKHLNKANFRKLLLFPNKLILKNKGVELVFFKKECILAKDFIFYTLASSVCF